MSRSTSTAAVWSSVAKNNTARRRDPFDPGREQLLAHSSLVGSISDANIRTAGSLLDTPLHTLR